MTWVGTDETEWSNPARVLFRLTRQFSEIEAASSARVTLDRSGRWHVSFTAPQPSFQPEPTGSAVGLDMGVHTSVATSNGVHLRMPKLLSPGEAQRKRRLQRKMARKTKGSNRRNRTKLSIAKLSAKEADRRKDWIEKTTTALVRDYDFIAIEDLRVKDMTRSGAGTRKNPGKNVFVRARINRSIRNQAWAMFRQRLTDKATNATEPVQVTIINPACTSLRCHECGHTDKRNRKSQAIFCCISCGHTTNADVNAAKNILAVGHTVTGRGGTSHARSNKTQHSDPVKRQPPEAA
jgi:putative transposase